jgi:hypothetical protein
VLPDPETVGRESDGIAEASSLNPTDPVSTRIPLTVWHVVELGTHTVTLVKAAST